MNTNRRLAMFAAIALVVTALADAAAGRQQARAPSGTGVVTGRVELTDNNQRAPLRRSTVTLRSESGDLTRTSATDADGAYRFDGLPAGNYRVSVEKAGFLTNPGMDSGNRFPESVAVVSGSQHVVNFVAGRASALEGRLIEDTGRPIAGLAITADRLADGGDQPARGGSYSARTDDLGRFRVHTIPPGRYRVSATPPSPASGARLYFPGTEKIEESGILVIAPGQTMDNLMFVVATASLPAIAAEAMATQELEALAAPSRGGRWAEITGRVTRSDVGQPIPNAAVKLSSTGAALLRTAWTNGNGEYSFRRVMPGAYRLSVSADGYAGTPAGGDLVTVADGESTKKQIALTPLLAIEGRVLDEFGDPAPGVFLRVSPQAAVVNLGEARPLPLMTGLTDDRGWFRVSGLLAGNYNLTALPEPFARSGPAAFPITSTPLQALAGIDVHGANLVLPSVPTTVISGVVVGATGRRVSKALVTLSPVLDSPSKGLFRAPVSADADGNFVFPVVPAGTYLVEARGESFELGSLTITTPIEPFVLALKPLPAARGRVTFDGEAPPQMKPVYSRSMVRFFPTEPTIEAEFTLARAGAVEPDWTFTISGLSSIGVIRAGEYAGDLGWTLARVLLQGRDVTDVPYDFQAGDVDGIEVVLTRRVGGITGTVQDGGKADPVRIIVFGADGDSWPYLSRTLRSAQANQSGAFTVRGLLPGRYFAVAVRSWMRSSPEELRALRSLATPIVVSEGAETAIKLSVVK